MLLCAGVLLATVPWAAGVAAAGGPISGDIRISRVGANGVSPAVAFNPQRTEYLVVWYNDRTGNDDIQAQRVRRQSESVLTST